VRLPARVRAAVWIALSPVLLVAFLASVLFDRCERGAGEP